jgi:DNA-3-methyladenine glycosylase
MPRLTRDFFARASPDVAEDLLGKVFARNSHEVVLRGRLVEVEAYAGQEDPGSHAFRGPTRRTQIMFGPAGFLYVYVIYGMHACMNVVTDEPGVAGAVLLRAAEPLEGLGTMEANRGDHPIAELCNGPGKLCQAFGVTRAHNGADLLGQEIWIEDDGFRPTVISRSARVGLSAGRELPLRYFLPDNRYVSRGKPSA